ncbi:hypothetical protein LZ30DRAFT_739288 [Colletotrichum cereale]|nr:hypothetical protein LZ30DRAFT_739288 [Colletotrichum cereale]
MIKYYSQDGTLTKDHALAKYSDTFGQAAKVMSRDCVPKKRFKGWVENIHRLRQHLPRKVQDSGGAMS